MSNVDLMRFARRLGDVLQKYVGTQHHRVSEMRAELMILANDMAIAAGPFGPVATVRHLMADPPEGEPAAAALSPPAREAYLADMLRQLDEDIARDALMILDGSRYPVLDALELAGRRHRATRERLVEALRCVRTGGDASRLIMAGPSGEGSDGHD